MIILRFTTKNKINYSDRKYSNRYNKSYMLFPSINVSPLVNSFKQLFVDIFISKTLQISYENQKICQFEISSKNLPSKAINFRYFGDALLLISNSPSEEQGKEIGFIGIIDNILMGFSTDLDKFYFRLQSKIKPGYIKKHLLLEKKDGKGFVCVLKYKDKPSSSSILNDIIDNDSWNQVKKVFEPSLKFVEESKPVIGNQYSQFLTDLHGMYHSSIFHPEGPFNYQWPSPCRFSEYQHDMIAMWDTLHIIENLKWSCPNLAFDFLKIFFGQYRESDFMIAQDQRCGSQFDGHSINGNSEKRDLGRNFEISQAPIWSSTVLQFATSPYFTKSSENLKILKNMYEIMENNIKWWEKNRFLEKFKVFGYFSFAFMMGGESGLDNSARFEQKYNKKRWLKAKRTEKRTLIPVDLNSQIIRYYEDLQKLSQILNIAPSSNFEEKRSELIKNFNKYCWNLKEGFYFDYDCDFQCQQPLFTLASLWVFYGNFLSSERANKVATHLKDNSKFYSTFPVPTLEVKSKFCNNNMWNGPVWISQNFWLLRGLKENGLDEYTKNIARSTLDNLSRSYEKYKKIFEYYPYNSLDKPSFLKLRRKGKKSGPLPAYIGHMPAHAIYWEFLENKSFHLK